MKKVLSIVLVLAMLLSFANVALAAKPVAERLDTTSIVNVTGKVSEGKYVNLLLLDGEEVKHIQEVKPESDGTYRAKFKYSESTDGLTLQVKQGNADVTTSVVDATLTESEAFSYTFAATTLKEITSAAAKFENWFNVEGKTYVLMIAFYDADGKLISVKTTDEKTVDFDASSSNLTLNIPDGTDQIKAFMWDSVEKMIPLAKEKTTKPAKELNILTIGNSFTDDPTAYLKPVATADGVTLNLTKAIHGGSSIKNHWDYYKNDEPYYSSTTVNGETVYTMKLVDYIDPELNGGVYYDIITFQQVSGSSGKLETYGFAEYDTTDTYDNCAENLAKVLRKYQPTAEIVLQETWAYEQGYAGLKSYSEDGKSTDLAAQTAMYEAIVNTVTYACEKLAQVKTDDGASISLDGKPLRYIPTGDAFQNAREFEIFQTVRDESKMVTNSSGNLVLDETNYISLHRDGYHSSHLHGRYLGALVWYGALTGNSPVATTYKHTYNGNTISDEAETILKKAAQDALDAYGGWN